MFSNIMYYANKLVIKDSLKIAKYLDTQEGITETEVKYILHKL